MAKGRQLLLLLWKNWIIITKQKPVLTFFIIALTGIFAALLVIIQVNITSIQQFNSTVLEPCNNSNFSKGLGSYFSNKDLQIMELGYAPDKEVVKKVKSQLENQLTVEGYGFKSEEKMSSMIVNNSENILGGLAFDSVFGGNSKKFRHKISFTMQLSFHSKVAFKRFWKAESMLPLFQRDKSRGHGPRGSPPEYYHDGFLTLQFQTFQAIMEEPNYQATAFFNDTNILIRCHRNPLFRSDKMNSMRMMGMNNWLHWMAWFIKYSIFSSLPSTLVVLVLFINFRNLAVVIFNDASVLFFFLTIYPVPFCCVIGVFFSKANIGSVTTGIIIIYIPHIFLCNQYAIISWTIKIATCLISNVALCYGALIISMFEGIGEVMQWSTINKQKSLDDLTLLHVIFMLLVDSVLYWLIAWYVETLFPGTFGVPQPWYFLIMKFDKKVAVAGMVLKMYEGKITVMLGHIGASKTTTMSLLTGFIPPTSGTAVMSGYDITTNTTSSFGLCLQHNILVDILTVEEHLLFFAKLKGYPAEKIPEEINRILETIRLNDKRHVYSLSLSGRMKQKLSIGIALIGDSKIVILDKPSFGLDINAHQQIWTALLENKIGRTFLMSPHFMEEAYFFGDRIAIMADGIVKCHGTTFYLKNKYGVSYYLIIEKVVSCNVSAITTLIEKRIPQAKVERNVGSELSYLLPPEDTGTFGELSTELHDSQDRLDIPNFGVSVTNMEEVFLKIVENRAPTYNGDTSDAALLPVTFSENHEIVSDLMNEAGGANPVIFWSATFLWDFMKFMVPHLLLLLVFWAFDTEPYIIKGKWAILFLFIVYAGPFLPLMHLSSFFITVPASGMVWLTTFTIFSGIINFLIVIILKILDNNKSKVVECLVIILLPNYCFSQSLADNYYMLRTCEKFPKFCPEDNCASDDCKLNESYLCGIGKKLVFLWIQGFAFFTIIWVIEAKVLYSVFYLVFIKYKKKIHSKRSEGFIQVDNDVERQKVCILNQPLDDLFQTNSVILKDLSECYGQKAAMDHLFLAIQSGECFGLLGINRAGETTTFKMLTSDKLPMHGNGCMDDFSISSHIPQVQQQFGYCPQFDDLIDLLTGYETLVIFARLRDVKEKLIHRVVNNLIDKLLLRNYTDKLVGTYNGGTKQKISTTIALVDEPVLGMNPKARRALWNTLIEVQDSRLTIILTPHSMDECETLCTKLAIMVNGQFCCLGTPQHLKSKFGDGYTLMAKIGPIEDGQQSDIQSFMNFVETLPGSKLKVVHYQIENASLTWAKCLEQQCEPRSPIKSKHTLSQANLKQIFIDFARVQIPPEELKTHCFQK